MRHLLTDLVGNPIYWGTRRLRHASRRFPSTLFYLIKNQAWNDVLRRTRTHPHEVTIVESENGNTPLHAAVKLDPPPEVIRKLKAASNIQNAQGATALHIAACHQLGAQALQALLEVSRETTNNNAINDPTAQLSRMGRAPIHYACMSFRGLDLASFSILLEATLKHGNFIAQDADSNLKFLDDFIDEEDYHLEQRKRSQEQQQDKRLINVLTLRDQTGNTPLGLLFRRYRERVRSVISILDKIRLEYKNKPNQASLAAAIAVQADLGQLWGKSRLIVARLTEERLQREGAILSDPNSPGEVNIAQAAAAWAQEQCGGTLEEPVLDAAGFVDRKFRIVHASVGLTGYGCPPEMIRLAISINPHQVREMDEDGNLVSSFSVCLMVLTCTI
jgi:ankyrin repeat protein